MTQQQHLPTTVMHYQEEQEPNIVRSRTKHTALEMTSTSNQEEERITRCRTRKQKKSTITQLHRSTNNDAALAATHQEKQSSEIQIQEKQKRARRGSCRGNSDWKLASTNERASKDPAGIEG